MAKRDQRHAGEGQSDTGRRHKPAVLAKQTHPETFYGSQETNPEYLGGGQVTFVTQGVGGSIGRAAAAVGSPRQGTFAVPSQWSRIEGGKAFLTLSFRGEFLWHFL